MSDPTEGLPLPEALRELACDYEHFADEEVARRFTEAADRIDKLEAIIRTMAADRGPVEWRCSERCWQEGGSHDESCQKVDPVMDAILYVAKIKEKERYVD